MRHISKTSQWTGLSKPFLCNRDQPYRGYCEQILSRRTSLDPSLPPVLWPHTHVKRKLNWEGIEQGTAKFLPAGQGSLSIPERTPELWKTEAGCVPRAAPGLPFASSLLRNPSRDKETSQGQGNIPGARKHQREKETSQGKGNFTGCQQLLGSGTKVRAGDPWARQDWAFGCPGPAATLEPQDRQARWGAMAGQWHHPYPSTCILPDSARVPSPQPWGTPSTQLMGLDASQYSVLWLYKLFQVFLVSIFSLRVPNGRSYQHKNASSQIIRHHITS